MLLAKTLTEHLEVTEAAMSISRSTGNGDNVVTHVQQQWQLFLARPWLGFSSSSLAWFQVPQGFCELPYTLAINVPSVQMGLISIV